MTSTSPISTDVTTPPVSYSKPIKARNYIFNSLPNPGKFELNHVEAQHILSPYYFAGARLTAAANIFDHPRNSDPDKQLIFIPSLEANHEGSGASLQVRSSLGQRHSFEGSFDTAFTSQGRYKYSNGKFSIKPAFQMQGGQELYQVEVDYKGQSHTLQANISTQGEATLSYNQSLTPRLTAGVQLFTAIPYISLINWTTKFKGKRNDTYAVSYKQGMLFSSYTRKIFEQTIAPGQTIHSTLATEVRVAFDPRNPFKSSIKGSEWVCGLQHVRPTVKYTATAASDWSVGVQSECYILPTVAFLFSGEMKYDGSNANKFGVGLSIG